jgi:RecA/RadA recombinase
MLLQKLKSQRNLLLYWCERIRQKLCWKLGVDIENLIISQPDNGEQALEIAENLIRSGAIDIVVIDSVAALTQKDERLKWEILKWDFMRLMSQALRKLTGTISRLIVRFSLSINWEKIGVMFKILKQLLVETHWSFMLRYV